MSQNPKSPTPEKWMEYLQGKLPEPESLEIESYIKTHGIPKELATLESNSADDSFINDVRKTALNQNRDDLDSLGFDAWKQSVALHPHDSDVKRLLEAWYELQPDLFGPTPKNGTMIGRYKLLENVSLSRMGRVYKGLDKLNGNLVAIKFPPDDLSNNTIERFNREIQVARQFDHPHIITVIDELQYRGMPVYVMPWIDGIDLGRLLRIVNRIQLPEVAEIGRQVSLILEYLLNHGAVHRDIKPSNLILTSSGDIKLIDLGLALFRNSEITDETYTESIHIIGSLDYLAPEQARDAHSADIRSDIYSLGCTLCKLLTGKAPFEREKERHALQKIMAHSMDQFPFLHHWDRTIPASFSNLLIQICAKKPEDRLTSPKTIAKRLKPFTSESNLSNLYQNHLEIPNNPTPNFTTQDYIYRNHSRSDLKSRRNLLIGSIAGISAVGLAITTPWKSIRESLLKQLTSDPPNEFLFAPKPQRWLDPHSLFVLDGGVPTLHVIDPDKNFEISGINPPLVGWNLAVTRSGKMFIGSSSGEIGLVDLTTNTGKYYDNLRIDLNSNHPSGRGTGGMFYYDSKSLYVSGINSGRLYKINTNTMQFDESFGEGGFTTIGQSLNGIACDRSGNIYTAYIKGVAKISPDGKTIQKDFINDLPMSPLSLAIHEDADQKIYVAYDNLVSCYLLSGKIFKRNYIKRNYEISNILIDQSLNLIYTSCYSFVKNIDCFLISSRAIEYKSIENVGLNLAQMVLPVPD